MSEAISNGRVPPQRGEICSGVVHHGRLIELTSSRPAPDVVVVHVGGEIDMLTAPELRYAVAEWADPPPRVLVIDLRAVTFLGASGLTALLDIRDAAARTATSVRLIGDTPVVTRSLELLNLREDVHRPVCRSHRGATAHGPVVGSSHGSDLRSSRHRPTGRPE